MPSPSCASLICHPASPVPPGVRVAACAWREAGGLGLRHEVRAPAGWLDCPPPARHLAARADGLWRRTCLEAFVAAEQPGNEGADEGEGGEGGGEYCEFNLSPDGCWAAYAFCTERVRHTASAWQAWEARARPARFACSLQGDAACLALEAFWPDLPLPAAAVWRVGLCAVLQAAGALSYWALRHPMPRPDFHHFAGRLLRLPPP